MQKIEKKTGWFEPPKTPFLPPGTCATVFDWFLLVGFARKHDNVMTLKRK